MAIAVSKNYICSCNILIVSVVSFTIAKIWYWILCFIVSYKKDGIFHCEFVQWFLEIGVCMKLCMCCGGKV